MTQEALATVVGVSRASIANIETGNQQITARMLWDVATALDVPPGDLLPEWHRASQQEQDLVPKDVPFVTRAVLNRIAVGQSRSSR